MEKQLLGMSGVYFVAAELSRRGYIALATTRNIKGVDLIVQNPRTGKSLGIEVKTRKYGGEKNELEILYQITKASGHEILYEKLLEKRLKSHYIFVYFPSEDKPPRYFVVPKDELIELVKKNIKDYLESKKHRKTREELLKTEGIQGVRIKFLKEYEDKWEKILNLLE